MDYQLALEDIRSLLGDAYTEQGDYDGAIHGIASLEEAANGDLSFCTGRRYAKLLRTTRASVVLLPPDLDAEPGENTLYIRVENPSLELARICGLIESRLWTRPEPGIHPSAVVDPQAVIDPEATIGPLCVVGAESRIGAGTHLVSQVTVGKGVGIGADCRLAPQVVVADYCQVGNRCRLHSGTVIGSDGFGYEPVQNSLKKIPQVGIVVLEDDVEMGALCSVDRARFSESRIGEGTKIDNMVHIAHNVRIGKHSAIAAQVGVSGSARIGSGVLIYGQAGLSGHVTVGDGAIVAGGSAVTKNVDPGQTVRGSPIMEIAVYNRIAALQRKLPEFVKRIEKLEQIIETSEGMEQTSYNPQNNQA